MLYEVITGMGLAGFVYVPFTSAAAVPTDARDEIFAVEAMTADYQTITIQGLISFRIRDAAVAATRQDFSINIANGRHTGEPMKQIVERLRAIAQTVITSYSIHYTKLYDPVARKPLVVRDTLHDDLCEFVRLVQRRVRNNFV